MVGQNGKIRGCLALGIAGGADKYRNVTGTYAWLRACVPLAVHLKLDLQNRVEKAKVKQILKTWFKNGVLATEEHEDEARKPRKFVVPGTGKPDDTVMAEDGDIDP